MPAEALQPWVAHWRPDPQWVNLPSVHREDLPGLFAGAEHRAWILGIEGFLKGEHEVPPPLDMHRCRFCTWLNAEGLARHGAQPAFQAIQHMHLQVHALALELLALRAEGDSPQALVRLGELHALRDTLLAALTQLLQRNSPVDRQS
jgi:hypothetical protein